MSQIGKLVALVQGGLSFKQAQEQISWSELSVDIRDLVLTSINLGAPISNLGKQLVGYEIDLERFNSEVAQANAVPIQTRKLLLWLPALSLILSQLAGFGTFAALAHPIGLAATVLAGFLIWIGISWSARVVSALTQPRKHPGLSLMRLSLALSSGAPLVAVTKDVDHVGRELIELSKTTGVPLLGLIESEISHLVVTAQQLALTQAKESAIKLLVPLALTVLPAFLILTIVPMFIGIGLQ